MKEKSNLINRTHVAGYANHWWIFLSVLSIIFLILFNTSAMIVSMVQVKRDLHLMPMEMGWLITGYFISLVGFFGASAQLGRRYGAQNIFTVGFILLIIATIILSACQGVASLMTGRIIQGMGAAFLLTCSLVIVRELFSAKQVMFPIRIWTTSIFFSYAFGTILGALMSSTNWRLNYWIMYLSLIPFAHLLSCYKHIKCPTAKTPCDISGTCLLLGFITLFVLLFSTPEMWGWTSAQNICFIILTPVLLILFLLSQHTVKNPIFPPSFFKNILINISLINLVAVGVLVFGTLIVSTLWFESATFPHGSLIKTGAFLVPCFVALGITSTFVAPLKKYCSYPTIFLCGALLTLAGNLSFLSIGPTTDYSNIWWRLIISGSGIGLLWGGGAPFCNSIVSLEEGNAMAGLTWVMVGIGAILGATLEPLWYSISLKHEASMLLVNLPLSKPQIHAIITASRDSKQALSLTTQQIIPASHAMITQVMRAATAKGYQGACILNVIFSGLVIFVMLLYQLFNKQTPVKIKKRNRNRKK